VLLYYGYTHPSVRDTTSQSLLEEIRDPGNSRAWRRFVDLYTPMIRKYARICGLRPDAVEDVTQECLQALVKRMPDFEYSPERGRFKSYLWTLVRNKIRSMNRGHRPEQARSSEMSRVPEPEPSEEQWEKLWQRTHLKYCLKKLEGRFEPKTMEAFREYVLKETPVEAVGDSLGMTPNQLYQAKNRILQRLKEEMRVLIGEEE